MRRLRGYLLIAVATVMAVCANETTRVSQEDVCVANPDSATIAALGAGTPALVNEITTTTAKCAGATDPHRPKITSPVTPSDSASVSLQGATLSVQL